MLSGFTATETVMELFMESLEFMHKIFNILFAKIEFWHCVKILVASDYG